MQLSFKTINIVKSILIHIHEEILYVQNSAESLYRVISTNKCTMMFVIAITFDILRNSKVARTAKLPFSERKQTLVSYSIIIMPQRYAD